MKYAAKDFALAIELVLRDPLVRTATVFQVPIHREVRKCQRVRCTRVGGNHLRITFGRPNYRERQFLKDCKTAKCQPKKYWLQMMPKRKK